MSRLSGQFSNRRGAPEEALLIVDYATSLLYFGLISSLTKEVLYALEGRPI